MARCPLSGFLPFSETTDQVFVNSTRKVCWEEEVGGYNKIQRLAEDCLPCLFTCLYWNCSTFGQKVLLFILVISFFLFWFFFSFPSERWVFQNSDQNRQWEKSRGNNGTLVLLWHIHKPYEFLTKEQCPQLDLKWGFLCMHTYGKWSMSGFYFIFSKRYQVQKTPWFNRK